MHHTTIMNEIVRGSIFHLEKCLFYQFVLKDPLPNGFKKT